MNPPNEVAVAEPAQADPLAAADPAPSLPGVIVNERIETVPEKIHWLERTFHQGIAQHAGDIWIRNELTGAWNVQTGTVRQRLIQKFESGISAPLWGAVNDMLAVDPNNDSAQAYHGKLPSKGWRPYRNETHEVCLTSGCYDLRTKTFTPFSADEIVFGPLIQATIDPCILADLRAGDLQRAPDNFRALMAMIDYALSDDGKADPATVAYFQQTVAQVLRPHCSTGSFVHIFGESGARKTTIMRALLQAPCGPNGLVEQSERLLAEGRFTKVQLVNRIANLSNDSGSSKNFPSFIKEVTSGVLAVEKKFGAVQNVRMTAKLFATMNSPQDLGDYSKALENRLIAFKFNERPAGDNDRSANGSEWRDGKVYTADDRQWIIHWLLVGLEKCFVDGVEKHPTPSERARRWALDLLADGCPARAFAESNLQRDAKATVTGADLMERAYLTGHALDVDDSTFRRQIGQYIKERFGIKSAVRRVDGANVRVFPGLALRPAATDATDEPSSL